MKFQTVRPPRRCPDLLRSLEFRVSVEADEWLELRQGPSRDIDLLKEVLVGFGSHSTDIFRARATTGFGWRTLAGLVEAEDRSTTPAAHSDTRQCSREEVGGVQADRRHLASPRGNSESPAVHWANTVPTRLGWIERDRMDVRSAGDVAPIIEHAGTVPVWWLIPPANSRMPPVADSSSWSASGR